MICFIITVLKGLASFEFIKGAAGVNEGLLYDGFGVEDCHYVVALERVDDVLPTGVSINRSEIQH